MPRKRKKQFTAPVANLIESRLLSKETTDFITAQVNKSPNIHATSQGSHIHVTSQVDNALSTRYKTEFVDFKPFFMNSSKVKQKKNGGWYLIIPIGVTSKMLRAMDWKQYKSFSHEPMGTTEEFNDPKTFQTFFQQEQATGMVNPLRYQWKSSNVTRAKNGNRVGYKSFRTVSDTSDPESWKVPVRVPMDDNNDSTQSSTLTGQVANIVRNSIDKFNITFPESR